MGKEGKALQKEATKLSLGLDKADTEDGTPGAADDPSVYVEQGSQKVGNSQGSAEALLQGFRPR